MNKKEFITIIAVVLLISSIVMVVWRYPDIFKGMRQLVIWVTGSDNMGAITEDVAGLNTEVKEETSFYNGVDLPDLLLLNLNGQDVRLHDYLGKPLVVISWATWCGSCQEELKALAQIQNEYGVRLSVVAINREDSPLMINQYLNEIGGLPNINYLIDVEDVYYPAIGGNAMPETIFLNSEGKIKARWHGSMTTNDVRNTTRVIVD